MRSLLLGALLHVLAMPALAQSPVILKPGIRVWVRSPAASGKLDRGRKGTVRAIVGDTLFMTGSDSLGVTPVKLETSARVFVMTGTKPAYRLGAGVGAIAGIVVGAIVAYSDGQDECPLTSVFPCFTRGQSAVMGAVAGGGIGLLAGLVVGATLLREERWTLLEPQQPAARVFVSRAPRGWRVGLLVALD